MQITYKQKEKGIARHTVLKRAIELLTVERQSSCCVRQSYVRDLYDYFIEQEETREQIEASKIDLKYIREWESIHELSQGTKRAEDLTVCFLSGPEPENDFTELVSLGVLPQNIWAFECERGIFLQALQSIDSTDFLQPKLIKTSIERFFENTPKKFDIVYIDACSSLISDQHALRCISTMFRYHRLESPGILISNFSEIDKSNKKDLLEYYDLLTKYFCVKDYPNVTLVDGADKIKFKDYYDKKYSEIVDNIDKFYGDFITYMICNAGSITVPVLRFVNSTYLQSISSSKPFSIPKYAFQDVNTIQNNTFYKYLMINKFLSQQNSSDKGIKRIDKLVLDLSAGWSGYDLYSCLKKVYDVRFLSKDVETSILPLVDFFEDGNNMYQFLDRPNKILLFDSVINQLSYPMHYCSDKIERLTYIAKETRMFTDLILFDECRYIYDWLPALHQMKNAFSNLSWQYIFRFALDGLVKQRLDYNNEFFFQGSVVSRKNDKFAAKKINERKIIN